MPDALFYVLVVLLLVLGLASLALAMERHWRQLRHGLPLPRRTTLALRAMGAAALAASLALCLWLDHGTIASLVWVMALVPAALAVTFTFSWRPQWFAPLLCWVGPRP
ncbi:MAG TPA: DUF3325 family protein [Steroidobacteraceae bacterium]|nr:DUF3325 family protein [Steroidobacteraceae bacterium]